MTEELESLAGHVLQDDASTPEARSLAGTVLAQAREEAEPQRLGILYIAPECLAHLLGVGRAFRVVASGLPQDASVIRTFLDHTQPDVRLGLVVESEAFPFVPPGGRIPQLPETSLQELVAG